MNVANEIISKLKLKRGMSITVAIQNVREYLDSQPDALKAANAITSKFGIEPVSNRKKAYVFAMTAVEQSLQDMNPTIEAIIKKSNDRIANITDIIGPNAFIDLDQNKSESTSSSKGSKREVAKSIYLEHKDKGDKRVIELVQEALGVTKQNAYTYVYLVKKDLSK